MAAAIIALRLPQFITPAWLAERRICHVGRRPHVRLPGGFGPARAHHRPVVMREIVIGVIEQPIELIALVVRLIVLLSLRLVLGAEKCDPDKGECNPSANPSVHESLLTHPIGRSLCPSSLAHEFEARSRRRIFDEESSILSCQ